jgi:acyl dehydratase
MSELPNSAVAVGDRYERRLVEDLRRAHIAQYAGASGDFNSVHVDELFASSEAGRSGVIAHGMLTMGLTATFVTSIVGHDGLRSFGGRFLAPVTPGDTLDCVATVVEVSAGDDGATMVSLELETTTTAGLIVFRGEATASSAALAP